MSFFLIFIAHLQYTKRTRAANAAQQRAASEDDADEVQEQRRIMLQNTLNAVRVAKRALTVSPYKSFEYSCSIHTQTTKPTPFDEAQYNEHPNSVPDNSDGANIYMERLVKRFYYALQHICFCTVIQATATRIRASLSLRTA